VPGRRPLFVRGSPPPERNENSHPPFTLVNFPSSSLCCVIFLFFIFPFSPSDVGGLLLLRRRTLLWHGRTFVLALPRDCLLSGINDDYFCARALCLLFLACRCAHLSPQLASPQHRTAGSRSATTLPTEPPSFPIYSLLGKTDVAVSHLFFFFCCRISLFFF